ncbi:MAG: hypothetical protein ABI363_00785 [Nitrosospira sp.]
MPDATNISARRARIPVSVAPVPVTGKKRLGFPVTLTGKGLDFPVTVTGNEGLDSSVTVTGACLSVTDLPIGLCPPFFPVTVTGLSSDELAQDADSFPSDTVTGNSRAFGFIADAVAEKDGDAVTLTDGDIFYWLCLSLAG